MNVPIVNNFPKLLEEKQREEGRYISLSEVSDQTGISRKTLYKWERGTVQHFNNEVIESLCKYFDVPVGGLLEVVHD